MKKNSNAQLGFKIVMMAAALVVVFAIIDNLQPHRQKPGEDNPLAILIGSEVARPLNWCPQDVVRLEIEAKPSETVADSAQIQSYCQTLSESFDSSKIDSQTFRPIMRAFTGDQKEVVLEVDATGQVFRYQGLPFGSKQLSRQLEKKFQH